MLCLLWRNDVNTKYNHLIKDLALQPFSSIDSYWLNRSLTSNQKGALDFLIANI